MSGPMSQPADHQRMRTERGSGPRRSTMLIFAAVATVGLGAGADGAPRPPTAAAVVRQMVFTASLPHFIAVADSPGRDGRLDWTSDGCSAPVVGSTGLSFDFTDPCRRHDFAYRNLRDMDGGRHWNAEMRQRVDARFRHDMRSVCDGNWSKRARCLAWSEIFYRFVRGFSGP